MTDPTPHTAGEFEPELGDDFRGRVKSELDPGERLLWAARPAPKPSRVGCGFVVAAVIAAALFLGSGVFLNAYFPQHAVADASLVMASVVSFAVASLILFVLVSIVTQRRGEWARRAGTLYALTDRRAIIWVPEPKQGAIKVYTLPRGSVTGIHRVQFPDGSGDVLFDVTGNQLGVYWGFSGFQGVADVRRVEEQVRRTLVDPGADPDRGGEGFNPS